eukprot:TRINITY_DN54702_c0_g1_i1.p1 TRINITY_DN54702_c0_g1~~TRINITY_DN54702_c0_g1_i1.p1  ORF type:complete len:368 (-),score=63.01 TRINITY_DN54702_c0_g1_i1:394-1497(-)
MATPLLLLSILVPLALAHMSLILPPPRNAIDNRLPPWAGGKWWPYQPECAHPDPHWNPQIPSGCVPPGTDGWGCNCANGTDKCDVGQSCLWFSDGCSIGCRECDGLGGNPNTRDRCGSGMKATVCDPDLRTYNQHAECNSAADIYRYNPWRAPGSAPVLDSCGMAGGGPRALSGEAKYTETALAKIGSLGSRLPEAPTGIVWEIGQVVTAKWSIRANHGGGYQYRLCPAGEEPTEECFFKHPLEFASSVQTLEYSNSSDPRTSEVWEINGTYVSTGTLPVGSTWARNPLPYSNAQSPPEFEPPCIETVDRTKSDTGKCSGRDPYNTLISDALRVPGDLAAGKYVLSIRWDCEKSAQVWTNCADIQLV